VIVEVSDKLHDPVEFNAELLECTAVCIKLIDDIHDMKL